MHTQEIPVLPMKIEKAPKKSKKGKGKDKGKGRASTFKNMAGTLHRFGLEVSLLQLRSRQLHGASDVSTGN